MIDFLKRSKKNSSLASLSCHGNLVSSVDSLFPVVKYMFNSISLQEVKLAFPPKLLDSVDFEEMKKGLKFFTVKQYLETDGEKRIYA